MLAVGFDWRLPVNASTHAGDIDHLIVLTHWFMAILFVGWGIYFLYCLVRFRSRPGHEATTQLPKAKASKYSEYIIVVIEAVLLLGFSIPIWATVRGAQHVPDESDAFVVRVVAQQFAWNIHYPGRDGIFGKTDPALIDDQDNPVGVDRSDPAAKDDIVTINQLHVPVNKNVLIHLTTKDVIHSFGVPQLRVKQDLIPGMMIPLWFNATKTTEQVQNEMVKTYPTRPSVMPILKNHVAMDEYPASDGTAIVGYGEDITEEILAALAASGIRKIKAAPARDDDRSPIQIACAQLCGLSHYKMRGYVHIDTEEQLEKWWEGEEEWLVEEEEDY